MYIYICIYTHIYIQRSMAHEAQMFLSQWRPSLTKEDKTFGAGGDTSKRTPLGSASTTELFDEFKRKMDCVYTLVVHVSMSL